MGQNNGKVMEFHAFSKAVLVLNSNWSFQLQNYLTACNGDITDFFS